MLRRGIVPEWEVFDFGMLDYAAYLRGRGLLDGGADEVVRFARDFLIR